MAQQKSFSTVLQITWVKITLESLFFIFACWLYVYLVTVRISRGFIDFTNFFVQENAIILISIFALFICSYLIPGWLGRSIRWIILISIFAIFLRGYWQLKRSAYFQLFGLLPWADSIEYYANGMRLLDGFSMQGTTTGRPLFSTMIAGILWVFKGNLPQTIMFTAGITALGVHLLGETIRKVFGNLMAAVMISFTFMWYRNYLGSLSSESLGLILACCGWILILSAVKRPGLLRSAFGFFLITLALVTRAGPFFILPFLMLVFWLIQPKQTRIKSILVLIASSAAGFIVNTVILRLVSGGKSFLFPNYLYSVYGMAAGGKGWNFIHFSRPDLWALPEPGRTSAIFDATVELIKQNPFTLIFNMLRQYVFFFEKSNTSVFSYLFAQVDGYNIAIMVILYSLSILSIILLIRHRKQPASLFLLAITAGVILSVPFVPPQDESDMRAFAVVIPLLALLPAYAANEFIQWVLQKFLKQSGQNINKNRPEIGNWSIITTSSIAIAVLILGTIPAFVLKGVERLTNPPQITCPLGEQPVVWRQIRQNAVTILQDPPYNDVHYLTPHQVERLSHDLYMSNVVDLFKHFTIDQTFSEVIDLTNGEAFFIFQDRNTLGNKSGVFSGCGVKAPDSFLNHYDAFLVSTSQPISLLK